MRSTTFTVPWHTLTAGAPPVQTAAALRRVAERVPDLLPFAAAAHYIASLPSDHSRQQKGIAVLFDSEALVAGLEGHLPDGTSGLDDPDRPEAVEVLTTGILDWEPVRVRAILRGVIEAGGLGPFILALERRYAHIGGKEVTDDDYRQTLDRLKEVEHDFLARWIDPDRVPEDEQIACSLPVIHMTRQAARIARERPGRAAVAFQIAQLVRYLSEKFSHASFSSESSQWTLTDYLMGTAGDSPDAGFCYPVHCLAAHLGLAVGIPFQVVGYLWHLNLFVEKTGWVVEMTKGLGLFGIGEMREKGLLGAFEKTGPLENLIAMALSNLAGDYRKSDPARAEKLYRAALSIHPDSSLFHLLLGTLLDEQDNQPEALSQLQSALDLNPANIHARGDLGNLLGSLQRFSEARTHLERAVRDWAAFRDRIIPAFGPNAVQIPTEKQRSLWHFSLAICLWADGELPGAGDHFVVVLSQDPNDSRTRDFLYQVAGMLLSKEDFENAAKYFERVLDAAPADFGRKGFSPYPSWNGLLLSWQGRGGVFPVGDWASSGSLFSRRFQGDCRGTAGGKRP